jgi:hypothetical protein
VKREEIGGAAATGGGSGAAIGGPHWASSDEQRAEDRFVFTSFSDFFHI